MSKRGSRRLRKALFFPAMSAMHYNQKAIVFVQRLKDKGKPPMVIVGALMTKLLHWIYGVLKNQSPFNPHHQSITLKTA